jgi:hypothetical protein
MAAKKDEAMLTIRVSDMIILNHTIKVMLSLYDVRLLIIHFALTLISSLHCLSKKGTKSVLCPQVKRIQYIEVGVW